ncbi:hypothetical protein ACQKP3_14835 [Vibrio sp. DNB22_10_4]
MNEYIVLEKESTAVAINIIQDDAGHEIRRLQRDGFVIVCESIKAYTCELALKLWKREKKVKEEQELAKIKCEKPVLSWQALKNFGGSCHSTYRTKIPGGWLVSIHASFDSGLSCGVTFVPDPEHLWDGSSMPNSKV